jgi:hypothetical protein
MIKIGMNTKRFGRYSIGEDLHALCTYAGRDSRSVS